MAASTHWLATGTAQGVLERGGNAVDAAVAAAFVLHLVEPELNGPGGDLTALLSLGGAAPRVLCGQGAAPAAATIEHYRGLGFDVVPGIGVLGAAVPGAVAAWFALLLEHGTWELADVLRPAIDYARDGHPLTPGTARAIERMRPFFERHWPSSAERWLSGETPEGGLATARVWAGVLERLVAAGDAAGSREDRIRAAASAWSDGFVAEAMGAFASTPRAHADGRELAGVLTAADVAAFRPRFEEPVSLAFRGSSVVKAGSWTQGPALLQALAMLDTLDDERLDPSTALGIHSIAEALKLALADRDAWYGDPDVAEVPLAELLASSYAAERAALIGETASREFRPGRPGDREPWRPPLRRPAAGAGEPVAAERVAELADAGPSIAPATDLPRGDTCHLDVLDRWGTSVSATPSGGWLQSSPTIPELGFCLGTRLQMTWLDPASPSALTPGGRPRSTLSPTMLMRDGEVVEVLGTPGGDSQDQWQLLYLLRRLVGGYAPQAAIDAPAFQTDSHVDSFDPRGFDGGALVVESRVGEAVIAELRERGHRVTVAPPWSLGRLSAVGRHPGGGYFAAANSRGGRGYASGR
ncbi:MAG: gamma-glutamyltransferase [Micrococcales bacterium]|nr:gamma-glutamyltransferase [Micrococcales bacterium]